MPLSDALSFQSSVFGKESLGEVKPPNIFYREF